MTHTTASESHPVRPVSSYVKVAAVLLGLAAVSVSLHLLFHGWVVSAGTLLIAGIQALVVILWSMGLKREPGFNILLVAGSFLFLAVFVVLTLSDVLTRGEFDAREKSNFEIKKPLNSGKTAPAHGAHDPVEKK